MIVVTAPTGNIGHQVLEHVVTGEEPVRVIVRDPARLAPEVRDRVEVVAGSHGDPAVLARAFAGADTVFWLLPNNPQAATVDDSYLGFTRPAAAALAEHGVQRVVDVSALGRGTAWADRAGYVTASLAMDDLLAGTGVAFRALTMPSFMDNLLRQVGPISEHGVFVDLLDPDRKRPLVATRDIAAVAARLLLDPTWTGQQEVPVLGPEDLSQHDLAAVLSQTLGTAVRYQQVTAQATKDRFTGFGMSEAMAQGMVDMMVAKDHDLDNGVTRTAQHAVETPTTFRQWCVDHLRPAVQAA